MSILNGVHRVLFVHAHPDDETIATGGLIAELASAGLSVWLVTATRGERGEVVAGPLSALEGTAALAEERERELDSATTILGVTKRFWLGESPAFAGGSNAAPNGANVEDSRTIDPAGSGGSDGPSRVYRDSGMAWIRPGLAGPAADIDETALVCSAVEYPTADLVALISYLQPDLVISYDHGGGYGHPDHLRIREAALAASRETGTEFAEIVATPGDSVEWFPLENQLDTVTAALRSYATQLTVVGKELVHSGGQRQPITAAVGLRPVR